MQRRDFIKSIVAAGASAAAGRRAHAVPQGWREFEITYVISLKDASVPAQSLGTGAPGCTRLSASRRSRLAPVGPRPGAVGRDFTRAHRLGGVAGSDDPARRENHRPGHDARPVRLLSRRLAPGACRVSAPDAEFADRWYCADQGTGNRGRVPHPSTRRGRSTTGLSTTRFAGLRREAAGSATLPSCSDRAILAASVPTSIRSMSRSPGRRGYRHATSLASASLT